jgi:hypothetical protein
MPDSSYEMMKKFPIAAHHEVRETFADQIVLTTFDGTTLRIELAVARMEEPKPPAPPKGERHIVCRVVLSVNCTVDLINQLNQLSAQLVQAGLIKMEQGKATPQGKTN